MCSASSRTAQETLAGRWEGVAEIDGIKANVSTYFTEDPGRLLRAINSPRTGEVISGSVKGDVLADKCTKD
jgi:hypothetical protein